VTTGLLVEVTELSETDLDASPPCESAFENPVTKHEFDCGKPSVVRARLSCPECKRKRVMFLCAQCYHDLRNGRLRCWYCFRNGKFRPAVYQEV
jgi:hypothetical protein